MPTDSTVPSDDPTTWATLQRYARAAGVAMLLSIIFGFLGEFYLPGRIFVRGDSAATAANILSHPTVFRLSFAAYLVEGICDVALCVFFYILLKPVNPRLALLSAFFGLASMVMYAVAQSSYFAASIVIGESGGMVAFTAEQRNAIALLCLRLFATISGLFIGLYGIASMLRGYLMFRSQYLPKVIGVLFIVGGAGFFLRTATLLVTPAYSSAALLAPMALAGIPLTFWLLVRGVKPNGPTPRPASG
jgi:hypothetical protein